MPVSTRGTIFVDEPEQPLLAEAGEALFGSRWTTLLPEEIGVDAKTLQQWLESDDQVPCEIWKRLLLSIQRYRQTANRFQIHW